MKQIGFWIGVVILLALLLGGGAWIAKSYGLAFQPKPQYQVAILALGEIRDVVPAAGTVHAAAAVEVGAEVSGRVVEVGANFNEQVKAGQVLARIDPAPFETALERARAAAAQAQSALQQNESEVANFQAVFDRVNGLFERGFATRVLFETSLRDRDVARARLEQAVAGLDQAQKAVTEAELAVARTVIRSPIDGFVLDRKVEIGQVLNANQATPILFTIASTLNEVEVEALVSEADISRVKLGLPVRLQVDAYSNEQFAGEIVEIRRAPQVEGRSVSYPVLVRAKDAQERLLPGMTAQVEFVHSAAQFVPRLPLEAISALSPPRFEVAMSDEELAETARDYPGDGPGGADCAAIYGGHAGLCFKHRFYPLYVERDGKIYLAPVRIGAQDAEHFEVIPPDAAFLTTMQLPKAVVMKPGDRVLIGAQKRKAPF